jgi:alkylation response protein AidB-like acyl-CoA dehydrogenase
VQLGYSEADEAFRADLRAWLEVELPKLAPQPARDAWVERRKWDTDWQRRLFEGGYAGLHWPAEFGGRGASPTEQLIFYEETARQRAPYVGVNFVGTLHAGPTLIEEGNDEQKAAHLPKILRGEEVWCQGFSEPGAGSDLASLRTRAERDGDDYVLNGQKIWCSFGQIADVGEFLVRTDPDAPKHRGISWLILPMDLPGIEVRPLKTVLGSSEFAEVFLTDVRVPVANRVGAENDGWRVTNVTLKYERGTAFVSELVDSLRLCSDLAPRAHDPAQRRELGRCAAELDALWALTKRNVSQSARGTVGPGAMVMKLAYSEARQRFGELCLRVLDRDGLHVEGNELVEERLRVLALTIAAGASQIQRNIIGERVLGFPKEAR